MNNTNVKMHEESYTKKCNDSWNSNDRYSFHRKGNGNLYNPASAETINETK